MLKSLSIGKEAENELVDYLNSIGFIASLNDDKELRYDYDVKAIQYYNGDCVDDLFSATFEVKYDKMATKTGNVAIEYHNSKQDKPSGISVTKADWWVHKIDDILWICKVSDLLHFTETQKPDKVIKSGGDKNANLYLYKIDRFVSICKNIKALKQEDLLL